MVVGGGGGGDGGNAVEVVLMVNRNFGFSISQFLFYFNLKFNVIFLSELHFAPPIFLGAKRTFQKKVKYLALTRVLNLIFPKKKS